MLMVENSQGLSPMQADVCSMQDSPAEQGHGFHEEVYANLDQDAAVGVLQQQFPAYSQVPSTWLHLFAACLSWRSRCNVGLNGDHVIQ